MTSPTTFWERHYQAQTEHARSGRANGVLVEVSQHLRPGRALDLGCGEGGDTIWLARHGWQVTAVDIAPTALSRVQRAAAEAGETACVAVQQHDLCHSFPSGSYDLVSAFYLHSPVQLPRTSVLRAAARSVAPGGLLIVVSHASTAPWSWTRAEDAHFPTAEQELADLDLDSSVWTALRLGSFQRLAVGPAGTTATVIDNVLALRRG